MALNSAANNNVSPTIKIITVYHKPSFLISNECLIPIHVGRAIAKERNKDGQINDSDLAWLNENMIGDDTGENISSKNRQYSELTGIYWAFKNYEAIGDPDYFGIQHYRRQFVFDEPLLRSYITDNNIKIAYDTEIIAVDGVVEISKKNQDQLFNPKLIRNAVKGFDILALKIDQVCTTREKLESKSKYSCRSDIEIIEKIVSNYYPDYQWGLKKTLNSKKQYVNNMFIMRRDLFFEACAFVFGVLFRAEKEISLVGRSVNGSRVFGYLSEFLFGAFFEKSSQSGLKVKDIKIIYERQLNSDNDYLLNIDEKDIPDFVWNKVDAIKNIKSKVHIYAAGELCAKYLFALHKYGIEVSHVYDHSAPFVRYGREIEKFDPDFVGDGDVILIASDRFYEEIKQFISSIESNKIGIVIT